MCCVGLGPVCGSPAGVKKRRAKGCKIGGEVTSQCQRESVLVVRLRGAVLRKARSGNSNRTSEHRARKRCKKSENQGKHIGEQKREKQEQ